MTSMDEVSGSPASQSRREALKKFGRYAAAAPTAMVLLESRESHAEGRSPPQMAAGRRQLEGAAGQTTGRHEGPAMLATIQLD